MRWCRFSIPKFAQKSRQILANFGIGTLALVEAVAEDAERGARIGPEPGGIAIDQRLASELGGVVVEADGPALRAVFGGDHHAAVLHHRAITIAAVLVHHEAGEIDAIDAEP